MIHSVVGAGYSFFKNERAEAGLGVGLHVIDIRSSVSASASLGNYSGTTGTESSDITAPIPNLRAYGIYAFGPRLSINGGVGHFSLAYDRYDGSLFAAQASLEYRFSERFGAGIGYNYVSMDLDVKNKRKTKSTHYDLDFDGPLIFLRLGSDAPITGC